MGHLGCKVTLNVCRPVFKVVIQWIVDYTIMSTQNISQVIVREMSFDVNLLTHHQQPNRYIVYIYKMSKYVLIFNPPSVTHPVGPLRIEFSTPVNLDMVRNENPNVKTGGRFKPSNCIALQKVAIIIPFRNREEHLKFWLYYLHPILQRQQLDYGAYVTNPV